MKAGSKENAAVIVKYRYRVLPAIESWTAIEFNV